MIIIKERNCILLGAFSYTDEDKEKHLYGLLNLNTESLDFKVKYVDDKELLEIYSQNPKDFDFTLESGLMYWRGSPLNVKTSIAKQSINTSFDMQLKQDSFYSLFWFLAQNKFMYIDSEFLIKDEFIPFSPLQGVCGFHELAFPEESLSIVASYYKGSELKNVTLLSYEGTNHEFRVLGPKIEIPSDISEYVSFDRDIKVGTNIMGIYRVNFHGSAIPDMNTLGMYIPNLLCFLKAKSYNFNSLVDTMSNFISNKSKSLGMYASNISVRRKFEEDGTPRIVTNLAYSEELVDLTLDALFSKNSNMQEVLRLRLKELGEVERFVVSNISSLHNSLYTDTGFITSLIKAKSDFNIVRTYYNLMLMIQRSSITYNTPSKLNRKQEGICGFTRSTTKIEVKGE